MRILAFDTETTCFPTGAPNTDASQPHIVQLAARLVHDVEGAKDAASLNMIIKPNGWTCSNKAAAIHGINDEYAATVGVSELLAAMMFMELVRQADLIVCHNVAFDRHIVEIALERYGTREDLQCFLTRETYCTMLRSRNVLKLPPTQRQRSAGYGKGYKNPKLSEAFKYFVGYELEGAHDAMVDVNACLAVYRQLKAL